MARVWPTPTSTRDAQYVRVGGQNLAKAKAQGRTSLAGGRGSGCRGLQTEDPAGTEVQAEQYAAEYSGGWARGPEGAHLRLAQVLALPLHVDPNHVYKSVPGAEALEPGRRC